MKTKEYYWGGNTYVCRIVQANDGEELIIAPTALLDVIQPASFEEVILNLYLRYYNMNVGTITKKQEKEC